MFRADDAIARLLRGDLSVDDRRDLGLLFHRLNNQLGIILANAELLEAKLSDEASRNRATQVIASVLDAMATAKEIRGAVNFLTIGPGRSPEV